MQYITNARVCGPATVNDSLGAPLFDKWLQLVETQVHMTRVTELRGRGAALGKPSKGW